MVELDIRGAEKMHEFGTRLGKLAQPGLVIGLVGELGAGKTTFVRGVAKGAGVSDNQIITSPTFVLIHEYSGRIPVYHFDTYRLADCDAFQDLGAMEYFEGDGVCLVEWADRVRKILPHERIDVEIHHAGETRRRVVIEAFGPEMSALVKHWLDDE